MLKVKRPAAYARGAVLSSELARTSVRGGLVTLVSQAVKMAAQFAALIMLARLIAPADFGLIAMVLPLFKLAEILQDGGLSAAAVQCETLSESQISALFWLNAIIGSVLALALFAASPLFARFYGHDELISVTAALAAVVFVGGLSNQHIALLQRQMRLAELSVLEAFALLAGLTVGVTAAWFQWGYWSLVAMQATSAILTSILLWFVSGWRPSSPRFDRQVLTMMKFGAHLTAARLVEWVMRSLDQILLGRYWGDATLGFYTRAQAILIMPLGQVIWMLTRIVVPALSRLNNEPVLYRRYFKRSLSLVATITIPVVVFSVVEAESIITLVLGDRWRPAIPIFIAMAPAGLVCAYGVVPYWLFASRGGMERQLKITLAQFPVIVLGVVLGVSHGAVGVALGLSLSLALAQTYAAFYSIQGTTILARDLLASLLPATLASMIGAGAIYVMHRAVGPLAGTASPLNLGLNLAVFTLAFIPAYLSTSEGRANIRSVWLRTARAE